jgi:hypothetical protein
MLTFWTIWFVLGLALAVFFDRVQMRGKVPYPNFPSGLGLTFIRISVALISLTFGPLLMIQVARMSWKRRMARRHS